MPPAEDPARRFRRSRWPDVILVVGVVALGVTGALALWGERFFHGDGQAGAAKEPIEQTTSSSLGGT